MDYVLSLLFNSDRIYITGVERTEKKLVLDFVDSSSKPIDLENLEDENNSEVIAEIEKSISSIKDKINSVNITIPSEAILVTQFPYQEEFSNEDLQKLIKLEVTSIYPKFDSNDFMIYGVPMAADKNGKRKMLAIIITRSIFDNCSNLAKKLGLKINKIEISQLNAHMAYIYNYPEITQPAEQAKSAMFVNINDNFMDISVIKNNQPLYYNLVAINNSEEIGLLLEKEAELIKEKYIDDLPLIYFFGAGLTKDINMMCWETSMMIGMESKRLNGFRMMSSNLNDRAKEYCSRAFHLFPACIGGCLAPNYPVIEIS